MDAEKIERRWRNRKPREIDQRRDKRAKKPLDLPLYFLSPVAGGRSPNENFVDDASRHTVAIKTTDLRKENRLRDKIDYMASPSSLRNCYREELFYRQDNKERLKYNTKHGAAKRVKRPLLLPPLPTRTFPRHISKQTNEFITPDVKTTSCKMFPKYLPQIETRKSELKDIDPVTRGRRKTEKTVDKKLAPLPKRTVRRPLRAAISSSATLRGLITLDLEEQFIFRFRLSNYDVKDINTNTLNEPV